MLSWRQDTICEDASRGLLSLMELLLTLILLELYQHCRLWSFRQMHLRDFVALTRLMVIAIGVVMVATK